MIKLLVVLGVAVVGYVAYRLHKAGKAVTVGNVVSAVKTDAATVQADVKKDVPKV